MLGQLSVLPIEVYASGGFEAIWRAMEEMIINRNQNKLVSVSLPQSELSVTFMSLLRYIMQILHGVQ